MTYKLNLDTAKVLAEKLSDNNVTVEMLCNQEASPVEVFPNDLDEHIPKYFRDDLLKIELEFCIIYFIYIPIVPFAIDGYRHYPYWIVKKD